MKVGSVTTNLSGDLRRHDLRLSGDQGLANFARFFETLLFRNRIVGCYRDSLAALRGNIDTFLTLNVYIFIFLIAISDFFLPLS